MFGSQCVFSWRILFFWMKFCDKPDNSEGWQNRCRFILWPPRNDRCGGSFGNVTFGNGFSQWINEDLHVSWLKGLRFGNPWKNSQTSRETGRFRGSLGQTCQASNRKPIRSTFNFVQNHFGLNILSFIIAQSYFDFWSIFLLQNGWCLTGSFISVCTNHR